MTNTSHRRAIGVGLAGIFAVCGCRGLPIGGSRTDRTFSEDVAFLRSYTPVVELSSGRSRVAVAPAYQGRVMTSTTGGRNDLSFGWLNYDLIRQGVQPPEAVKGALQEHIYVFGGEERFWMGPEGGQYAIFFRPGSKFDFDSWFTPPIMDTEVFAIERRDKTHGVFTRDFALVNYSGAKLNGNIRRTVRILDPPQTAAALGANIPARVRSVAYQTENTLRNRGPNDWKRETGLLSVWLLGMFRPGDQTTVVIPFKPGPDADLGPRVNDTYFGKVPSDRLVVRNDVLFFSGDGKCRAKIGITPKRARGIAASYDAARGVLTIVRYTERPSDLPYVNSMWEIRKDPYAGDVINSYNDGPPKPGMKPLGPFYELETSSPAAELKAGESLTHTQTTFHLEGSEAALDPVARKLLGVGIGDIKTALKM